MLIRVFALFLLAHQILAWFEDCDHNYTLTRDVLVQSPYYPERYPSGSSCRYTFTAPLNNRIGGQCTIELDKTSSSCSTEFFYVASDGDKLMRGSQHHCGTGKIDITSMFGKVAIAYTSSSSQTAGRFFCKFFLIPITQSNCDCGWSMTPRIVSGTESGVNEFPSIVALFSKLDNSIFCGGTIISYYYTLTAAHCVHNTAYSDPTTIFARVGEHDTRTTVESRYQQDYSIRDIIIHNQYDGEDNDIALLRLHNPMEWSMGVGPACVPYYYRYTDFTNAYAVIAGWGTLEFAGPRPTALQKASVVVDSQENCAKFYDNLSPNQICTKPTYNSNSDACQFDSGGPLFYVGEKQYIIGTIIYGLHCGNNKPAVNTRVVAYISWIESVTGGGLCQR